MTSAHAQHAEPHADDCGCTPPPAKAATDSDHPAAAPENGAGRRQILRGAAREAADATADATTPSAVRPGLFEHAVCRVSGLPVDALESLCADATVEAVDALAALEAEMETLRPGLSDALYDAIGDCAEKPLRGRLLAVRRDVHNLRPVAPSRLAAVRPVLEPELAAGVERYAELSHSRRRVLEALPAMHRRDMDAARRGLQGAAADADFQCGLLLSSRVLFAGLERYRATPAADFTAKERQVERGMLRYLSRMAMKTTPFGTFAAVVPARLTDDAAFAGGGAGMPYFDGDPRSKRSLVRLNKRIYAVLRGELLADPEVRRHVAVELNPTLHVDRAGAAEGEGGRGAVKRWRFLTSLDGKEVFQRLPRSAVLDLYQSLLSRGPRPLGELEEELLRQPVVDAPAQQVAAYTERLLELGFLRFRLGVAPQEVDWDRPLLRLLDGVPGETAARVAQLVRVLRRQGDAFATAPVGQRARLLDAAREAMEHACPALLQRAGLRTDLPFYEDAGADARLLVPRSETAALEASLVHYVSHVRRLAWPRHEASVMRRFFAECYGEDAGPVPLLRFYEDYYRDHVHREAEARSDGAAAEPAVHDLELRGRRAFRTLYRTIQERWRRDPEAPVLHLTRADLESAFAEMPPPVADACSISLFTQLLPGEADDGGPALLVSSLVGGFGKYFSRFLGLFPGDVYRDLRRRNAAAGDGALLAEIAADGDFNANLHPPLVPWEVDYPTAEGSGGEGRLSVDELVVEPHPRDPHTLRLRRGPGGPTVVPLDLGFLNPLWRPPLFRLLVEMAPAASFHLELPMQPEEMQRAAGDGASGTAAAAAESLEPRVVHRPRVVYDGRLVLARRRWEVPVELFPVRGGETDDEYFLRADRWRRRCGLPREIFVSLYPFNRVERAAAGLDAAPPQAASNDDDPTQDPDGAAEPATEGEPRRGHRHKPQYVDFANPLLVDLFGRLVDDGGRRAYHVYLYERLPAGRHLPRSDDGARHVTELVVEVDLAPGGGSQAQEGGDV